MEWLASKSTKLRIFERGYLSYVSKTDLLPYDGAVDTIMSAFEYTFCIAKT